MPKWKKNEIEFNVRINNDENGGNICRIPKLIMEMLGIDHKIKFEIKKNDSVLVSVGTK